MNKTPPLQQAPNAFGDARTLESLAYDAERAGHVNLAAELIDLAIVASAAPDGTAAAHIPTLPRVSFVLDPSQANKEDSGLLDLRKPIVKAIATDGMRPRKTPFKINSTMLALGAYDGIRDPAMITGQSFKILRKLSHNPYVEGIRSTRKKQAVRYAKESTHPKDMGCKIALRDERAPLTRAARQKQQQIIDIILHGGISRLKDGSMTVNPETGEPGVWDGYAAEKALPLRASLAIEVDDLLTMDWSCLRMEPSRDGKWPVAWVSPVDSAQIRRTEPSYYGRPRIDDSLRNVTLVEMSADNDREVVREYDWSTMSTLSINHRMEFFMRGYGTSPIETALDIVLSLSKSLKFQQEYYDNSHLPYGILQLLGMPAMNASRQYMDSIKMELARAGGEGNFWNLMTMLFPMGPNGQAGRAEFMPFRQVAGAEMQSALQYESSLRNLLCLLYDIDPSELGFESLTLKSSTLNEKNPITDIQQSQQRGWIPLMEALAQRRNQDIVYRIDPDFEFRWVNLDPQSEQEREAVAMQRFQRGWSANRIAASNDEEPFKTALDPVLLASVEAKYDESKFDTHDEYRKKVEDQYEAECKKLGYVKFWSAWADLPVGAPTAMQVIQMEQQANDAATGHGQQMGMPGQPGIDPQTGQPIDPNAQQPGAPGQQQDDGQEPDPNADLQPHHLMADQQQPPDDPADEDDDARRDRYKRAMIQRLLQQQQTGPGLKKALRSLLDDGRQITKAPTIYNTAPVAVESVADDAGGEIRRIVVHIS